MEREKSGREEIVKFSPSTGQPVGTEAKITARLGGIVIEEDFFFLFLSPFLSFFSFPIFWLLGRGDNFEEGKGGGGGVLGLYGGL